MREKRTERPPPPRRQPVFVAVRRGFSHITLYSLLARGSAVFTRRRFVRVPERQYAIYLRLDPLLPNFTPPLSYHITHTRGRARRAFLCCAGPQISVSPRTTRSGEGAHAPLCMHKTTKRNVAQFFLSFWNLSTMLACTHGVVERARPMRRGTAKRATLTNAKASAPSFERSSWSEKSGQWPVTW